MRRRLQTIGLVATLLVVAVLAGSMIAGVARSGEDEPPPARVPAVSAPAERVRVEVLNAAGVPGLARRVTQRLRRAGFDVVYFGNAAARDSSAVIDRVGRDRPAREVAEALGVAQVRSEADSTLYLDVTVLLGRDWREGAAEEPVPAAEIDEP